jgi:nucleoside-diphosphate-sugar epimerase
MKRILITGYAGQIGTELTMALVSKYGKENVFGTDLKKPDKKLLDLCSFEKLDVTKNDDVFNLVEKNKINTIYHMAAILSAVGEAKPSLAWDVNMNGLYNILEASRTFNCSVFIPSSIAAFGPETPKNNTPQDTIQRPTSMYGVTKVAGEILADYYHKRFGVDARGVRYPGIISHETLPGGGTTDYAVEIFYEAIKNKKYTCFLKEDTLLDMMYMPDAIKATISLMEADSKNFKHRNAFNITAIPVTPKGLSEAIKKIIPEFTIDYDVDFVKQSIADSWPSHMDDSVAQKEWGWNPTYDLDSMVKDMLNKLSDKLR